MHKIKWIFLIISLSLLSACQTVQNESNNTQHFEKGSFGYDLAFLRERDSVAVLSNNDAQVIVSPKYQGKVFTSTADGEGGKSFGWINYRAFDQQPDPHMNAYGGENRFWLGPEGNKFSLFFKPGSEMVFDQWVTPPAIDTESWTVEKRTATSVSMTKQTELQNYAGTNLKIAIRREVVILSDDKISEMLGIRPTAEMKSVGYSTFNEITNAGTTAWTKETGAPCIWILDMFNPSPSTMIIIPYREKGNGKVVTTDYFGEVPPDRITVEKNVVVFKADGKSRGKIGISPERAEPLAGSFDAENNILTVVKFDVDSSAVYLNQEWNTRKDPFTGDAVNAYNDGPLEDGTQMGPFYELESVSPAAFLQPGDKLSHTHSVFHFIGERKALLEMIEALFGPSEAITSMLVKD